MKKIATATNYPKLLTVGKEYEIIDDKNGFYTVVTNKGKTSRFPHYVFSDVEKPITGIKENLEDESLMVSNVTKESYEESVVQEVIKKEKSKKKKEIEIEVEKDESDTSEDNQEQSEVVEEEQVDVVGDL